MRLATWWNFKVKGTMDIEHPADSQADMPGTTIKPSACTPCRVAHLRCDGPGPVCNSCQKRNRECGYPEVSTKPCLICKTKKKKCDRQVPSCTTCLQKNQTCQYDYPSISSRRTLQPVHRSSHDGPDRPFKFPRLSMPTRFTGQTKLPIRPDDNIAVDVPPLARAKLCRPQSIVSDDISVSEGDAEAVGNSEPTTNGDMLPLFQRSFKEAEEQRSASVEFMEIAGRGDMNGNDLDPSAWMAELKEAISHRTDTSKPGCTVQAKRELARLSQTLKDNPGIIEVQPNARDLRMPPRKVADHLLAVYLTREYVNLPIFHLPAFHAKYIELYTSENSPDDTGVLRGILNVAFALGCLATGPNSHVDASMYFMRAQRLIRPGSLQGVSLSTLQAYIITCQYLMAINNFEPAWGLIGLTIRVAETLRLHLGSGSQHSEDRVDRELARRLWHSCILLERTIALNLGPHMIVTPRSFQAPLPTPLENEYVDVIFGGEPTTASDRPSIIEFFTAYTRLMERYEDIIAVQEELRPFLHHPHKVMDTFDSRNLLNADRKLCNWMAALPPFLVPGSTHGSLENPIAKRQHNILRIRYLNIRLLLWRPLLGLVAASPDLISSGIPLPSNQPDAITDFVDSPIIRTIIYNGACKCILSAREIISILIANRQSDGKVDHLAPVPAWWENLTPIFTCALVLLAARLCPADLCKKLPGGNKSIKEAWKGCMELLNEYQTFNSNAGTYLDAIESLATCVAKIASTNPGGTSGEKSEPQQINDVTWLEALPGDLPRLE